MVRKLLFLLFPATFFAQGYTSYFTGNLANITTTPEYGVCMMGGATEHDNAMIWLLQKANGGDVVVLRSSGSDGYNDYLYSELGVNVNSVETLVITSVAGATNPYVLDKVSKAELIWFAGGDQWNYVSYFKDNALEDLINDHINVKQAPIGGTSAGMAILGGTYFSAQNGSVTSAEALSNPYNPYMTFGHNDFVNVPMMQNTITDTHYDDPDRRGRHSAFLARLKTDYGENFNGIACNEYVAVCIDAAGKARVYGDYPNYEEFAYFLQSNCQNTTAVEVCEPNSPLTWNYGAQAIKAYKVPGTMTGVNYFNVSDWDSANIFGGSWENWSVASGVLNMVSGSAPDCSLASDEFQQKRITVSPNPFRDFIRLENAENANVKMYDLMGKLVLETVSFGEVDASNLHSGIYLIKIEIGKTLYSKKLVKI
ncbi:T9SS type A sorting domain-containing protein [Flavobacterium sp.]|uniref:T9SS type A sorting domain-containing protein n=1 Tax=Flavobacterium sp. TaxID=239 RepID=UPI0025C72FD8|nr:T9SS type A sorting domain-containing protein [Flavobacterium sp.]